MPGPPNINWFGSSGTLRYHVNVMMYRISVQSRGHSFLFPSRLQGHCEIIWDYVYPNIIAI